MTDPRELSASLRDPQLEPADHVYVVLQDHGPGDGGWGPAAVRWPGAAAPMPFVYTGGDPGVLEVVTAACRRLAQETGKPTRLALYTRREDVYSVGGSS